MKSILSGACAAAVIAVLAACGSSGGGAPQTQPSGVPSGGGVNATSITILGDHGAVSFTPNPAPNGNTSLQFKNGDSVVHHIMANDGSFDTGEIAPGATSKIVVMSTDGTNYHCTIHPGMIGAVSASDGAPPPCRDGVYC